MKRTINLFLPITICFSLCANQTEYANQAELLKKLTQETKPEQKETTDEGNSLVYNLYDTTKNGIKGAIFAYIAIPCTGGLYAPYAIYKFGDLLIKKLRLYTGNAEQFGDAYCKRLEKETALRELTNRGAKAAVSVLPVLVLYKWTSNLSENNKKIWEGIRHGFVRFRCVDEREQQDKRYFLSGARRFMLWEIKRRFFDNSDH